MALRINVVYTDEFKQDFGFGVVPSGDSACKDAKRLKNRQIASKPKRERERERIAFKKAAASP